MKTLRLPEHMGLGNASRAARHRTLNANPYIKQNAAKTTDLFQTQTTDTSTIVLQTDGREKKTDATSRCIDDSLQFAQTESEEVYSSRALQ